MAWLHRPLRMGWQTAGNLKRRRHLRWGRRLMLSRLLSRWVLLMLGSHLKWIVLWFQHNLLGLRRQAEGRTLTALSGRLTHLKRTIRLHGW